jgi:alpha,alpha-trehalase
VLARSDRRRAWALFREALQSDLGDVQGGTTQEGIHIGAMAATVDLVIRCYTGCEMRENQLRLNPCLPESIKSLKLNIRYQDNWLELSLTQQRMMVAAQRSTRDPTEFWFRGELHRIEPGQKQEFDL